MNNVPQLIEFLESRRLLSTSNLVADVGGIYPTDTVELNGVSYFAADDGAHGKELWRSDGTRAGTTMLKDLRAGASASSPKQFHLYNGELLFFADNANGTVSLWRSDGTANGTTIIANVGKARIDVADDLLGGKLIFTTIIKHTEATYSAELWSTDGATAAKITDLVGAMQVSSINLMLPTSTGRLVIGLNGGLWSTDGTANGTVALHDHDDDNKPGAVITGVSLDGAVIVNSMHDGSSELWRTDGTQAGTVRLVRKAGWGVTGNAVVSNGRAFLELYDGPHDKTFLFSTDGTAVGTKQVAEVNGGGMLFDLRNGKILLALSDTSTGGTNRFKLLTSDGTTEGTQTFAFLTQDAVQASPMIEVNGKFFIVVCDSTAHADVWQTDGTAEGTVMLKNIWSTGVGATIESFLAMRLTNVNGTLAVTTPAGTQLFDPASVGVGIGPAQSKITLSSDGVMRVFGTRAADIIKFYRHTTDPSRFVVSVNGMKRSYAIADVRKLIVYGYSGNDNIAFNDRYGSVIVRSMIWSGDGNDTVYGGTGRDTVFGEGGRDYLNTGRSNDEITGGAGNDTIVAAAGDDTLSGDGGADKLDGGVGHDFVSGGEDKSRDAITADSAEDVIFGSAVYDIFYGANGDDLTDDVITI